MPLYLHVFKGLVRYLMSVLSDLEDDFSDFYADDEKSLNIEPLEPWNILIVDDEDDIHQSTLLALKKFEFEGRKLSFTHAYNAEQALDILSCNNNFALVFVDVVMESDDSGLELVKAIRTKLNNKKSRLILRTGQAGSAPEDEVIRDYDINDYRNKSELTAAKLKNTCYTALRSYRDLCDLERSQYGLSQVICATTKFQNARSHNEFASDLLEHVAAVAQLDGNDLYSCIVICEKDVNKVECDFKVLAVSGSHKDKDDCFDYSSLPADIKDAFDTALQTESSIRTQDYFVGYFKTSGGTVNLMYVSSPTKLTRVEHNLLEQLSNSVAVSYENMNLRLTVQESQGEITYLLGEAVEKRSRETGSHVKRVANYCYLLAKRYGLSEVQASHIRAAAPLHDVGKIAIPDDILHKPGKLNAEEWQVMQTHASEGAEILSKSKNSVLKMGAIIAGQHHEKWNGTGYPNGLSGDQIHIAGRITALADVFDALSHERCYKTAWPEDEVLDFIRQQKGYHFDPKLVDLFFDNLDQIREIRDQVLDD